MSSDSLPDQSDVRPAWQIRRERLDESARAILAVLEEHRGEWVPVWRTLCDAQLRDDRGLVDVALVESIDVIQHSFGIDVERRMEHTPTGSKIAYRLTPDEESAS